MIRALTESVGLFLLPFVGFAIVLLLTRQQVLHPKPWSGRVLWLAIGGLAIVLASFMLTGFLEPRPVSGFAPTRIENGRVVPGHFE